MSIFEKFNQDEALETIRSIFEKFKFGKQDEAFEAIRLLIQEERLLEQELTSVKEEKTKLLQQVKLLEQELASAKQEKTILLGLLEQRLLESPGGKRKKGKKKSH